MTMSTRLLAVALALGLGGCAAAPGAPSGTYRTLKAALDAVPAIDTHDHLFPFDRLPGFLETDKGRGMTLAGLWRNSYLTWYNPITPWKPGGTFDEWWGKAKHDFDNVRASSFYRYQLPAFQDLYGIDFDLIIGVEARARSDRVLEHSK